MLCHAASLVIVSAKAGNNHKRDVLSVVASSNCVGTLVSTKQLILQLRSVNLRQLPRQPGDIRLVHAVGDFDVEAVLDIGILRLPYRIELRQIRAIAVRYRPECHCLGNQTVIPEYRWRTLLRLVRVGRILAAADRQNVAVDSRVSPEANVHIEYHDRWDRHRIGSYALHQRYLLES